MSVPSGRLLSSSPGSAFLSRPDRGLLLAVTMALLVLLAWLAWGRALNSTLEAESAEIAREFLRLGDWTVNHMNGQEDYDKPPLFYWLIAFFRLVTGASWELASRLPSLLSLAGFYLLFWGFSRVASSRVSPLLAFALFLFNPKVLSMAQTARMDLLLSLFAFAALFCFLRYRTEERAGTGRWYYLFFLCMALAVMTKGPVGFILTGVPVFLFLVWERDFAEARRLFLGRGMLLFLVLALPWFVVASVVTEGRFFRGFFLDENLSRFGNWFHGLNFVTFEARPFWRYVPLFVGGFFPWVLLVPPAFLAAWRERGNRRSPQPLLLIYCVWIFFFFSLSGIKRGDYILPIYPVAAWLVAYHLQTKWSADRVRHLFLALIGTELILLLLLVAARWQLSSWSPGDLVSPKDARMIHYYLTTLARHDVWLAGLLVIMTLLWLRGWKVRGKATSTALLVATQGVLLGAFLLFQQVAARPLNDPRAYAAALERVIGSQPVCFCPAWDEEYGFYLHREIPVVREATELKRMMHDHDRKVFVLMKPKYYARFLGKGEPVPFLYHQGMPPERPMYLIANFDPAHHRSVH